jgi:hypothetical protein
MYSTANDLFKWSLYFQKQLRANGSLRNLISTSFAGENKDLYSSGWCILPNEILHTGHINGFANLVSIDTTHRRTIIILSNSDYKRLYVMQETIISILNKDKDPLGWIPGKLKGEELNAYTGTYQYQNIVVPIKNEDGKLVSYVFGKPVQLFFFRKDEFFAEGLDGNLTFGRDKDNKVISVTSFEDYSFTRFEKTQ